MISLLLVTFLAILVSLAADEHISKKRHTFMCKSFVSLVGVKVPPARRGLEGPF